MKTVMRRLISSFATLGFFFYCLTAQASPVIKLTMKGDFEANHMQISQALESHRFYVIFESNIGRSLSNFKERWSDDYNQNQFEEIRSLVFCNPWYVNQVINKDPEMAALCPLSVTLLHKDNNTRIMFLRPSQLNPESPAQPILEELEQDILKALNEAVSD